jgi:hypothetical protein
MGVHTYAEEGTYATTVTVTDAGSPRGGGMSTAMVLDAPISLTPQPLSGSAGAQTSGVVAALSDAGGLGPPSQYTGTIAWGDGQSSVATIAANGDVTGAHTYVSPGSYTATVNVADDGGQSASAAAAVSISPGVPAPCTATAPSASPPYQPTATTPDARWIQAIYHDLLQETPPAQTLAAFSGELGNGLSREVLVSFLEGDPDRPIIVGSLYNTYLHRPADPAGLSSGVQFLAAGGSDEQLAATLIGSAEYLNTRGGGTTAGFLGALYCDVLARTIDPGSLASWTQMLAEGMTRQQVAQAVLSSTEHRIGLIKSLYLRFLRRPSASSDNAFWLAYLQSGASDEQLIAKILSSQEYFNQFTSGGGTLLNPRISQLGVIHLVLLHPATLQLRVFALLPAVQRARTATAVPGPAAPRTRLLGTVNLGRHKKGRVTVHWNRRIGRRRLRPGRYVLLIEARSGNRLRDVSDRIVTTLR